MKKSLLIVFLLVSSYCNFSYSQTPGEWTWMKGDSVGGGPVFGTQGIPSINNNPPNLYEAGEWTDLQGNLWLYGGVSWNATAGGVYGDLWKYDVTSNTWTWINGPGTTGGTPVYGTKGIPSVSNYPGARAYGMFTWTDKQ